MTDLKPYIEQEMGEDIFYESLGKNIFKAFGCVALLSFGAYAIYTWIVPLILTMLSNMPISFMLVFAASYFVFLYLFHVNTIKGALSWIFITFTYSGLLYLLGEAIIVAAIVFGVFVTAVALFGEGFFTTVFTYLDLREWVKTDISDKAYRERIQSEALLKQQQSNEEQPNGGED